jgi:hypothetical protein
MASDFPVIDEGSNANNNGDTADNSVPAAYYSQTSDTLPYGGGDESSDVNRSSPSTPNERRNPYHYKKQKNDASADSDGRGDYRKDREEWSESAIACLLEAYTDKLIQLSRGNLRGKDWEEVAETISKGCDKKIM